MSEIKVYNPDMDEVLYTTDDPKQAQRYMRENGHKELPVVINFGENWKTRWSGRMVLRANHTAELVPASQHLKYMLVHDNPALNDSAATGNDRDRTT